MVRNLFSRSQERKAMRRRTWGLSCRPQNRRAMKNFRRYLQRLWWRTRSPLSRTTSGKRFNASLLLHHHVNLILQTLSFTVLTRKLRCTFSTIVAWSTNRLYGNRLPSRAPPLVGDVDMKRVCSRAISACFRVAIRRWFPGVGAKPSAYRG